MKREILFRGFNECGNGTQIAVVNGKEYRGEWVEGCYVYDNNLNHHIRAFDNRYYAVIPETVCEWTGLTDKNGKKIFEGDIIFGYARVFKSVVKWNSEQAGWSPFGDERTSFYADESEIIGNKWEE